MNAHSNSRRGATLTDLIVTVAVVLLLLAVGTTCVYESARGPDSRSICRNNQHQIATAMLNYEASHGHFPGIANPIIGSTPPEIAGYLPMILPYLERNDLWKEWLNGNRPTPYMAALVCAGDPPPNTTSDYLCYVVNGGMADVVGTTDSEIQASGICFDRTGTFHKPIQVDMTYLNQHDGASETLLLTENLDADHWGIDGVAKAKRWNSFVWHPDPIPPTAAFNHRATSTSRTDPSIAWARPSSNHLNGVNVVFCDGHHQFVQNSIDYKVWRQMMTSNSKLWP